MTDRPVGRPPKEQPALVRDVLLLTAARHFTAGYASASVRRIAAELGVSQSTVQHQARTKEALLFAVIDEVVVPQIEAAPGQALAAGAGTGTGGVGDAESAARLRHLVRLRLAAIAEHGGVILAVLDDSSPGYEARQAYLFDRLQPARRAGLDALAGLADRGLSRRYSDTLWTAMITLAVPAIVRSWARVQALEGAAASLEQTLDEVADLLVFGMLPRR